MTLVARPPSQELVNLVGAIGGRWHGNVAHALCPAHSDQTPSLTLRQGDRGILVTCFAGCAREDILRELGRVRPGQQFRKPPPAADPVAGNARAEQLWMLASEVRGTIAEAYLRFRGLAATTPDVRFHPRVPFGRKPDTVFEPALLVGVRIGDRIRAFQRIFLKPDGRGYTRKAALGELGNGAWQSGPATETMAIAEGFEDAAAFAQITGIPAWAALGARRFSLIELPAVVKTLIIAEDNDPEGRRAAREAFQHYRSQGLKVQRRMPPGKLEDWAKAIE